MGRAKRSASLQSGTTSPEASRHPAHHHSRMASRIRKSTAMYAVYQQQIMSAVVSKHKGTQRPWRTSSHTAHMSSGSRMSASSHMGLRRLVAVHRHQVYPRASTPDHPRPTPKRRRR